MPNYLMVKTAAAFDAETCRGAVTVGVFDAADPAQTPYQMNQDGSLVLVNGRPVLRSPLPAPAYSVTVTGDWTDPGTWLAQLRVAARRALPEVAARRQQALAQLAALYDGVALPVFP